MQSISRLSIQTFRPQILHIAHRCPMLIATSSESQIMRSLDTFTRFLAGQDVDEDAILALPRRRPHAQRPAAQDLACAAFPEETLIKALIKYEEFRVKAAASVRAAREARLEAARLSNNAGGKLIMLQGPWKGQELDPLDLNGPKATPMPVKIPGEDAFSGVFKFLSANGDPSRLLSSDADDLPNGARIGKDLTSGTPFVEFDRGIVYVDGRLDLCKMVLGPTHIGALIEALEKNQHVTQFLLGNNIIATTGAKRIAAFIRSHPERIETWYIAGCHITTRPFKELADAMAGSSRITNVWLKRNPLGTDSVPSLVHLISSAPHLRTLDLENTELGDAGVAELFTSLKGKPSALRNIYLNALGLGVRGCRALAEYLDDPASHMESLFLASNPIGDAGMAELAPVLGRHKSLVRISLASTGLTQVGISQLCNALADHPNLLAVDLGASLTSIAHSQRYNYVDGKAVPAIARLINAPAMRWLGFSRTALSPSELAELKAIVAQSNLVVFEAYSIGKERFCDLATRQTLLANRRKFFPEVENPEEFLTSEACRFLRNTPDVRLVDSQYRTQDKKLKVPPVQVWEDGDETWKLVLEDAKQV